ncbi:MAG: YjjG family noncanonical pyrimidine nucleotidase [Vicingaceae bacterium]|nr:YjjG family noncanonical pyrimidine nucleotidase [Vicingaceae bacterium]
MSKHYEHIFFDLDRTLWHFDENSKNVLNEIFVKFELARFISNVDEFLKTYEVINEKLWKQYSKSKIDKEKLRSERFYQTLLKYGADDNAIAVQIGDYYINHSPQQTTLLPHTIETLDYLKNKYELHIITNGFEEVQLIKLSKSGIMDYFNQLVFSEKVGVKKPHPLIFKKAIKNANAHVSNSIMIGDDYYADIYGATRAGMDSIYFNFNNRPHQHKVNNEINCLSELTGFL